MASYFGKLESFSLFRFNKAEGNDICASSGLLFVAYVACPEHAQNQSGHSDVHLPFPHNAPRSPIMDPLCWEIKWEHRDDCVSALMVISFSTCLPLFDTSSSMIVQTLRRIPHLTVTWAHQPLSTTGPVFANRFNPQVSFPLYQTMRIPHHPVYG